MQVMMPLPTEGPLKRALCDRTRPLVRQFLIHAIEECPEDFADEASVGFTEQMLADSVIHLLREKPELLDHLYGNPARG